MNKSYINLFLGLLVFLSMSLIVSADVNQNNNVKYAILEDNGTFSQTSTSISNFNVQGYVCTTSSCNNYNGTLWSGNTLNSGSNSNIVLTYPQYLLSAEYGIIFYKTGYFPFEAVSNLYGNGNANDFNLYLSKKRNCAISIDSVDVKTLNQTAIVNVTIISPINNAGPINFVPSSLSNYYSVDGFVNLTFSNGSSSNSVIQSINLPASEKKSVLLNSNLVPGNYTLSVKTYTTDSRCLNSVPIYSNNQFTINSSNNNQTNNTNNTSGSVPFVSITSPSSMTYTNNSILLSINTFNATNVWYNINNGANISYNSAAYVNFANGSNIVRAYANNSAGLNWTSVSFYVNSTSNNQTNNTNNTSGSVPFVRLNSPLNIQYNNTNILVNISTINATNVWYNVNGVNYTYTNPIYFNFSQGLNNINAYANNSAGLNSTFVSFYVNNSNISDTTAPGSVTGLHVQNIGTNYIYWVWNNPSDSDFAHNIIYIDGINVLNSSNNFYNLTGLNAGSTHTIRIETSDFAGNINHNIVSNSATTNSNNNNHNNNQNSGNGTRNNLLGPYISETGNITNGTAEDIIILKNNNIEFDYSWLLLVLMILILVLLLLIIFALTRKK